jgi:hypothetical protein
MMSRPKKTPGGSLDGNLMGKNLNNCSTCDDGNNVIRANGDRDKVFGNVATDSTIEMPGVTNLTQDDLGL